MLLEYFEQFMEGSPCHFALFETCPTLIQILQDRCVLRDQRGKQFYGPALRKTRTGRAHWLGACLIVRRVGRSCAGLRIRGEVKAPAPAAAQRVEGVLCCWRA